MGVAYMKELMEIIYIQAIFIVFRINIFLLNEYLKRTPG